MNPTLRRAKRILNEEGIASLLKKSYRLAKTKKVEYIDNKYWNWKGGIQKVTVGPVSANFEAKSNSGGNMIRWTYLNEYQMISDLITELESDDVYFDIGAHIGFFTCFAANHLSGGSVVAFEPHPPNVEQLRRNLSHNSDENTEVHQLALSDSNGEVQFSNTTGLNSTASFESGEQTATVNQVKGDDLVGDRIPVPTVVKIDVEGAEPLVINGMKEALSSAKCRALFCEIHLPKEGRPSIEDYGYDLKQVFNLIEDLGFKIVKKEYRGEAIHLKGEK